jgi:alpha-mannosidase
LNNAIQSLAWNIDISDKAKASPFVVFNPHAWPTKTNIELEMGELKGNVVIVDDKNAQYPLQLIQSQSTTTFRSRISFTAELPAMGYALFHITTLDQGINFPVHPASNKVIENDNLRLEVDQQNGGIKSLYDKANQREILSASTRAVVINDPSDTWSHDVLKFDEVLADFKLDRISLVEHGPVKSVIRSESIFSNSHLIQDFTLFQGLDWVKVDVTVDWHEQQKMLKLRFPINLTSVVATYEIPYGFIKRPTNGIEFPGQSWVDLTGSAGQETQTYGISLLNDSKYSFDIQNNEIGLTVLRSPIYAHHNPAVPQTGIHYNYIDQGVQHFTYILFPHAGSWQEAGTIKRALELNQLPVALASTVHQGSLPASASFLSVDCENIIVSVVKKAEDGDGLILRAYETAGYDTRVKIQLPFLQRTIQVDFKACEIKTLLIPFNPALPPLETNLLEYLS